MIPAFDVHGPEGAPLVVLGSSLGTTRGMWDPQLDRLATRFRVVRYDHRGHGGSPVPPGPYRLEDLAGDVVDLLDHLGAPRAHHVGLSLGGVVALWLAAYAPERVDRLCVLCTAPSFPPASAWTERAATVRAHGTGAIVDTVLGRWFTPAFAASGAARAVREAFLAQDREGYASCCEALAATDLTHALGRITAATLAVAGAEDPVSPPERLAAIAGAVGGEGRVAVVAGAAHLANVEQAEAVTALLLEHLEA